MKRIVFEGKNTVRVVVKNIRDENKSPTQLRYDLMKCITAKINVPLR